MQVIHLEPEHRVEVVTLLAQASARQTDTHRRLFDQIVTNVPLVFLYVLSPTQVLILDPAL